MASNLINKYVWVVETIFRAGKISFAELNRRWIDDDISEGKKIPRKTFDNWRYAILDLFGLNIECEHYGEYLYYIDNKEDIASGGIRSWVYNNFRLRNILENSLSIKDRILLENIPSSTNFLSEIVDAMKKNKVVHMIYNSYKKQNVEQLDVLPLSLKLFQQRWYLVAIKEGLPYNNENTRRYSLDRIKSLSVKEETFNMPEAWDGKAFFDSCYGIFWHPDIAIEEVVLKVDAEVAPYLVDLPLHSSQKEVKADNTYRYFSYQIRPTIDLQKKLLSFGETVEVVSPLWLRKAMYEIIRNMQQIYEVNCEMMDDDDDEQVKRIKNMQMLLHKNEDTSVEVMCTSFHRKEWRKHTNGLWGYASDHWLIEPQFTCVREFHGGVAPVCIGDLWGVIDIKGRWVVEPCYSLICGFYFGLAAVIVEGTPQNCRYGYLNPSGEMEIPPTMNFSLDVINLPNVQVLFDGLSYTTNSYKGEKDIVCELDFERVTAFSYGLAAFKKDGLYGYIDIVGNVIIEPRFNTAYPFHKYGKRGVFAKVSIKKNGIVKEGFVNRQGMWHEEVALE